MMTNYLLSYPRSGNTWVRYIVEVMSKRPTIGYDNKTDIPIGKRRNIGVNLNAEPILIKRHNLHEKYKDGDKLILIVRDYKECIIRHSASEDGKQSLLDKSKFKFDKETNGLHSDGVDYIGCIEHYEKWPGDKLFVYYEDLLTNHTKEIPRIVDFLGIDKRQVPGFLDMYRHHFKQAIQAYHEKSYTGGVKLQYHQNKIPVEFRDHMVSKIKKQHPRIYEQYLKRYG
jgi:hypothetical protein